MGQQTNRIPTGFLDLVGAETGGKTPPIYADVLGAQVDVTELLLGQTLCGLNQTWNHNAVGNVATMSVRPDEAWLLRYVAISDPLALVTDLTEIQVGLWNASRQEYGNDLAFFWTSREIQIPAVGDVGSDSFALPEPILLMPGTTIYWQMRKRAGAARNATISAGFNLLRAGSR